MEVEDAVKIYTTSSSATAPEECRGHVLVSGSYGGEYNAYHAAKFNIRGVVLSDAGIGKNNAGINGLAYLEAVGLPAATADARTCHIGDGDHILEHGIISFVNKPAADLRCAPGQSVRECADLMRRGGVISASLPPIAGGKRYIMRENAGERKIVCVDAAPTLLPEDAGAIAITGSHAALFRGQPDAVIGPDVFAVFFNDAGVGKDDAGITRLAELDKRKIAAGAVSASSAPIGDSRAIYADGILSHINGTAANLGGKPGMRLYDFVEMLVTLPSR